jgi:selenide,water dikinase
VTIAESLFADLVEIAFDPQTSGGLLVALPKSEAPRAIDALREARTPVAVAIGHVIEREDGGWVRLQ